MFNKIDKHSGTPAYIQIMNQIKKEIFLGNIKSEEQLPPVRELQKIFEVNINTVTRALEKLSSENVVEAKHGIGHFIKSDEHIDPEIIDIIISCVKKLKDKKIEFDVCKLLLEEVWKND